MEESVSGLCTSVTGLQPYFTDARSVYVMITQDMESLIVILSPHSNSKCNFRYTVRASTKALTVLHAVITLTVNVDEYLTLS